jgi:hypothetical protein
MQAQDGSARKQLGCRSQQVWLTSACDRDAGLHHECNQSWPPPELKAKLTFLPNLKSVAPRPSSPKELETCDGSKEIRADPGRSWSSRSIEPVRRGATVRCACAVARGVEAWRSHRESGKGHRGGMASSGSGGGVCGRQAARRVAGAWVREWCRLL